MSNNQNADPDLLLKRLDAVNNNTHFTGMEGFVPSRIEYNPSLKGDMEATWREAFKDYNVLGTWLQNIRGTSRLIKAPNFDASANSPWKDRFEKIIENYNEVLGEDKILKGIFGIKTMKDLKQKSQDDVKQMQALIIAEMDNLEAEIVKKQGKLLEKIEAILREDLNSRLDWMKNEWEKNPPKGYSPEVIASNIAYIEEVRKRLANLPKDLKELAKLENWTGDQRFEQYRDLHDDIDKLEAEFLRTRDGSNSETIVTDLDAKYKRLEKLREDAVKKKAAEYMRETDLALADLDALIAQVEAWNPDSSNETEVKQKESELKDLRATRGHLLGGRDLDKVTREGLISDEPRLDGNGKPIIVNMGGKEHVMKKGLYDNLMFMRDLPLTNAERAKMSQSIEQSFELYEQELQGIDGRIESFKALRFKISQQIALMNPTQPGWQFPQVDFLAIADVNRAFEIISEWAKSRYARDATRRVGRFMSRALKPLNYAKGPLSILRTIPNEYDKSVEGSEQQAVSRYKDIYANKDMWQVLTIAYNTSDQDEFKACLGLLAAGGRIRWDDTQLLAQFNKFQNDVKFEMDLKVHYADVSLFDDKLNKACGAMWDFDTFKGFKNQNSGAYDSKKNEYKAYCDNVSETNGGLTLVAQNLLDRYRADPAGSKVDPMLYEQVICYAMTQGKMGTEERLYFLIQGIALGLLAPDRGSALTSNFLGNYPVLDFFASSTKRGAKPTLEDIKVIAAYDKTAFIDWYHRVPMATGKVRSRIEQLLARGTAQDHDDLQTLMPSANPSNIEVMLQKGTQGYRVPSTGIANGTVGYDFYFRHMAENRGRFNAAEFKKQFSIAVASFSVFRGITMNLTYKERKEDLFRFSDMALQEKARADGSYDGLYGQNGKTVGQNMNDVQKFLNNLDKEYFSALEGTNRDFPLGEDKDVKKLVDHMVKKYGSDKIFGAKLPTNINELYAASGSFTAWLFENRPEQVDAMLSVVARENEAVFAKMEAKEPGSSLRSKRVAGTNKIVEIEEEQL